MYYFVIGTNTFSNSLNKIYYHGFNIGASYNYFLNDKFSLEPYAKYSIDFFNSI